VANLGHRGKKILGTAERETDKDRDRKKGRT